MILAVAANKPDDETPMTWDQATIECSHVRGYDPKGRPERGIKLLIKVEDGTGLLLALHDSNARALIAELTRLVNGTEPGRLDS